MPARDENMIAALKRERAGYVARGLDDRVAEVDEQLREYGYEGEQDAVVDPTGGAPLDSDGVPKGRTTRPRRTATAKGGKTQAAPKDPAPASSAANPAKPTEAKPTDAKKDGEGK